MTCLCSLYDNDDLFRKLRPEHSAARDIAWGKFYGDRGAWNAIVQAERGGTSRDNAMRIAHWRNKVATLPKEILHKDVPIGAGVVLNFRRKT